MDEKLSCMKWQSEHCEKLFKAELNSIIVRLDGNDRALELKAEGLENKYVNRLTLIAILFTTAQIIIQIVFLLIWLKK